MTQAKALAGRSALVTGGSRGIGLAIAQHFASAGGRVAICGRDVARLEAAGAEIRERGAREIIARPCDVRRPEQVRELVTTVKETWGTIDILVNNAGISGRTPLTDSDKDTTHKDGTDALWRDILATNLDGIYHVTRAVLSCIPSPGGRIINISSVLGRFGVPGYAAYCTTKHGIIGFTRALALEVAERGITVNAICPGWVATEMAWKGMRESAAAMGVTFEAFRERAMAGVPIGRMIEPDEVAELALYLASDAGSGTTGQAINVCGGQTMD